MQHTVVMAFEKIADDNSTLVTNGISDMENTEQERDRAKNEENNSRHVRRAKRSSRMNHV